MPLYQRFTHNELLRAAASAPTATLADPIGQELQARVEQQAEALAGYRDLRAVIDEHGLAPQRVAAVLDELMRRRLWE